MSKRCPCCGMPIREFTPREREPWTQVEKEMLSEKIDFLVNDLMLKFGRSSNALWWAIWRYVSGKKR